MASIVDWEALNEKRKALDRKLSLVMKLSDPGAPEYAVERNSFLAEIQQWENQRTGLGEPPIQVMTEWNPGAFARESLDWLKMCDSK